MIVLLGNSRCTLGLPIFVEVVDPCPCTPLPSASITLAATLKWLCPLLEFLRLK